jgi:hypothetical protein
MATMEVTIDGRENPRWRRSATDYVSFLTSSFLTSCSGCTKVLVFPLSHKTLALGPAPHGFLAFPCFIASEGFQAPSRVWPLFC